ncbi:unnamed protein product, partial [Amoebophrya sp. A25]
CTSALLLAEEEEDEQEGPFLYSSSYDYSVMRWNLAICCTENPQGGAGPLVEKIDETTRARVD